MSPSPDSSAGNSGAGQFQQTHWSLVLAAGEGSQKALAKLCQAYWYPLYAFLRRKGYATHDAKDLTQGFFAVLLEKNYVRTADPLRGRFRSFLLGSFKRYLAQVKKHGKAKKRGGDQWMVSLEESEAEGRYAKELCEDLSPDKMFERKWALAVLNQAAGQLKEIYEKSGKANVFNALHNHLTGDGTPAHYGEIADKLRMSEGAVRVAVSRLRNRFGEQIRSVISHTVLNPGETEEEVQHLYDVLRQ